MDLNLTLGLMKFLLVGFIKLEVANLFETDNYSRALSNAKDYHIDNTLLK